VAPYIEEAIREARERADGGYLLALKQKAKIEVDEKRVQAIATLLFDQHRRRIQKSHPERQADAGRFWRQLLHALPPDSSHFERNQPGIQRKATVLVIDVYKYKELAGEYRVQVIPP